MDILETEHDYLFDPPLDEVMARHPQQKSPTPLWKVAEIGVVFVATLFVALAGSWYDSESHPDDKCCDRNCRGEHYQLVKIIFIVSIAFLAVITCLFGYYYGMRARQKRRMVRLVIQMRPISPPDSPFLYPSSNTSRRQSEDRE